MAWLLEGNFLCCQEMWQEIVFLVPFPFVETGSFSFFTTLSNSAVVSLLTLVVGIGVPLVGVLKDFRNIAKHIGQYKAVVIGNCTLVTAHITF